MCCNRTCGAVRRPVVNNYNNGNSSQCVVGFPATEQAGNLQKSRACINY